MSTSRSLNKVMLIGNLTRDPVIKVTPNGSSVCSFGLATNTTWKSSDGELKERTEFHNIVSWNKLGEICASVLCVGMLVYVEGELRTRVWEDANSVRHYRTEIKIEEMKLLDSKGKRGVGVDQAKKEGEGNEVSTERQEGKDEEKKEDKEEKEDKKEKKSKKEEPKKGDKDINADEILF